MATCSECNGSTVSLRPGGSSWQSLARGVGTIETDYLNGEIVLLGRLHGVPIPANAALQAHAREMARSGAGPGTYQPGGVPLGARTVIRGTTTDPVVAGRLDDCDTDNEEESPWSNPPAWSTSRPIPSCSRSNRVGSTVRSAPFTSSNEGLGPTLLLLHGNPDWSFLYRKIVIGLRGEFRCVVPDYPGFGLSVHPAGYGYTPAEHGRIVGELVDHLDLTDMVVMGQDWGGPIGMEIASQRPARRARARDGEHLVLARRQPHDAGVQRRDGQPARAVADHAPQLLRLAADEAVAQGEAVRYRVRPLRRRGTHIRSPREGIAVFPVEITRSHPWLRELEQRVSATLTDTPVVLLFGRKDPALASDSIIEHWRTQFPDATYVDLPDAGHYIQEDAPDAIIDAIRTAFGGGV